MSRREERGRLRPTLQRRNIRLALPSLGPHQKYCTMRPHDVSFAARRANPSRAEIVRGTRKDLGVARTQTGRHDLSSPKTVRLLSGGVDPWRNRSVPAVIAAFPSKVMTSSLSLRTVGLSTSAVGESPIRR